MSYHSWETDRGSYNVRAANPSELRKIASDEDERSKRSHDTRAYERAQAYYTEADKWEREESERKRIGAELKRRRANNTRARTADFNAQYSPTQEERDKERARAARLRS